MGRPRTDIQPRILRAARARFLVDGVDGASLRTIAKEAGTSIGMVFYYYPTKDDLFLAVIEERYAVLLADLDAILQPPVGSLRERLREVFARLGRASEEELDVIRLVVREALLSSPRLQLLLARLRLGHIGMMLGALADGVMRGEIRQGLPLPVLLATTFGIGAAPQVARRVAGDALPFAALPAPDELADMLVSVLFDGVAANSRAAAGRAEDRPSARRKRGRRA